MDLGIFLKKEELKVRFERGFKNSFILSKDFFKRNIYFFIYKAFISRNYVIYI